MASMLYARPDDNLARLATVTASAEDPEYPAERLVDGDVANPAKLTATSGSWKFAFDAPVAVKAAGLLNHNLDAGLEVHLQANDVDDWGAPPFDELIPIPVDEDFGDGLYFSVNPWCDLRPPDEYPYEYQFWRIWIAEANSENVALGEAVLLAEAREFAIDPTAGIQRSLDIPDIVHTSGFGGRSAYGVGAAWRIWDGAIPGTDDADEHWALAQQGRGRVRPWFFVPDQAVNSCYLVTFDWTGPRFTTVHLGDEWIAVPAFRLREVSRGVPL